MQKRSLHRKTGLLTAALSFFLLSGLQARLPGCFSWKTARSIQSERPKFYALRVLFEEKVQNAIDSLGAPDNRYAEIQTGGHLVLLMEKEFDLFPRVGMNLEGGGVPTDSGSVVGKGGADLGLEVWSPYQDKLGKQHYAWMPAGLSATGFSFPLDYSYKDKTGVNTIRISNLGAKSLFVDAVIGYDEEVERE